MVSELMPVQKTGSMRMGLNPCCRGIWSRSILLELATGAGKTVLILVVVEYGLGETDTYEVFTTKSLNPCCRGIWSRRYSLLNLLMPVS